MAELPAAPAEETESTEAPATEEVTETTEAPAEGAETPAEGEPAAEEKPAEPAAAAAEIPEDVLRKAAIKHANRTMAAARRAERAVEEVRAENARLKQQVEASTKNNVLDLLKSNPGEALRAAGYTTVKGFLEALANAGEPKAPSVEDEVAQLKRERDEERAKATAAERERVIEASKTAVFNALAADAARWGRANTRLGRREVWEGIETYAQAHGGQCPDEAVYAIADGVQKALAEEFGDSQPAAPAKPAAGKADPAARTNGKTLTNKGSSGAPVVKEYSMDPDIRRRQITEDMRAAGEL